MTMTSTTTAPSTPLTGDEARTLLGQTMGLVTVTAGFFALGVYLGRDLSGGWAIASYLRGAVRDQRRREPFRAARDRPPLESANSDTATVVLVHGA